MIHTIYCQEDAFQQAVEDDELFYGHDGDGDGDGDDDIDDDDDDDDDDDRFIVEINIELEIDINFRWKPIFHSSIEKYKRKRRMISAIDNTKDSMSEEALLKAVENDDMEAVSIYVEEGCRYRFHSYHGYPKRQIGNFAISCRSWYFMVLHRIH